MRARTYILLGIILVLIVGGVIAAQVQRAKKTRELLADLGIDASDIAIDTMDELRKRGSAIEDELMQRTASPRREERMRAAVLLGDVGTTKCGPALLALLDDEWLPVRRAAVWALGKVGYEAAVDQLLGVAKDEEAELDTRCVAVQSLSLLAMGKLSDTDRSRCALEMVKVLERRPEITEEALETIKKRLTDEKKAKQELKERQRTGKPKAEKAEEPAKAEETKAAGEIPAEPVPVDTEIELRGQAVLLLGLTAVQEKDEPKAEGEEGGIGKPSAALKALFDSTDEELEPAAIVRQYACMAIADRPEVPLRQAEAEFMARRLYRALDDADATVRMFAARALARHANLGESQKLWDDRLNGKLAEMAEELIDLGEPGYWAREAARTACSARHVPYAETPTATGEEKSKTSLVSVGGTGGK